MRHARTLCCSLSIALLAGFSAPPAQGQAAYGSEHRTKSGEKLVAPEARYPNTSRPEPARPTSSKIAEEFNKLVKLANDDKPDETIAMADKIIANAKANNYERAVAAQAAAYAWINKDSDDYSNALKYMQQALQENGLDNNAHFDLMYQMAQMHLIGEDYSATLITSERFLVESKSNKAQAHALQGNAYYRQDKFAEAITALKKAIAAKPDPDRSWSQMLMAAYFELDQPAEAAKIAEQLAAATPNDKAAQLNLATIYLQADQPEKAALVIDRLRVAGLLVDAKDYETAYKLMANIDGRQKDALVLINEGLAKGVLQPSHEIYNYLGQTYYFDDQIPQAISAWEKAAPLGSDGETYLNLAKVLAQEGDRAAEANKNARLALAKGVKKPGDAWMVIARAEYDLHNKPGMLDAYREAAKHPETREQATRAIKQASGH